MKSRLAIAVAAVTLLAAAPCWAQSLTPIHGWVPLNSPRAKALMTEKTPIPSDQKISIPPDPTLQKAGGQ